ncbi:uncharacterized protein LOC111697893 [Eurytemora carolleeae]|uniref:uncharacterized protein LOC111697893 n=1 Tax=Eurytemora carolleeae TaxID=1294199 RepID=UPI000C75A8BE|nr:uncharacterized protein LOC111697893 [Eurytemora carolleeae]|eukprot:XP_023323796.1 uncharacterized protein LOC111697893 [Eurytemora affinis]
MVDFEDDVVSIDLKELNELYEVFPDQYLPSSDSQTNSDPRNSLQQIIEEEEDIFDEEDESSDEDHADVDQSDVGQGGEDYADDLKQDDNEEEKKKISDISDSSSDELENGSVDKSDVETSDTGFRLKVLDSSTTSALRSANSRIKPVISLPLFPSISFQSETPSNSRKESISLQQTRHTRLDRSPSQTQADFVFRLLSSPEEYESGLKMLTENQIVEKRSPTGRKLSTVNLQPKGRLTPRESLVRNSSIVSNQGEQFSVSQKEEEKGAKMFSRQSSKDFQTGTLPYKFGRVLSLDNTGGGSLPRMVNRRPGVTINNSEDDLFV